MDEIIVTGEFAGPGMWQVTHPNYPGHTLWIVAEPPPLPREMHWHSRQVERVALNSQEILLQPGFSLKPGEKIGMFRMLTLVPAALKARKNPDNARLKDLIPPDTYARWLAQKKLYLGHDSGIEKWRPMLAAEKLNDAALEELRLGGSRVYDAIAALVQKKKIPVTQPNREFTFKTDDLRAKIKAFSREKLADTECFAKTVERIDALSNKELEEARARAWATGDLDALQQLPPLPNRDVPCFVAVLSAQAISDSVPADLPAQLNELWFAAAADAVTKNESTLATVQMDDLFGEQGYLLGLRQRGFDIIPPGSEKP